MLEHIKHIKTIRNTRGIVNHARIYEHTHTNQIFLTAD